MAPRCGSTAAMQNDWTARLRAIADGAERDQSQEASRSTGKGSDLTACHGAKELRRREAVRFSESRGDCDPRRAILHAPLQERIRPSHQITRLLNCRSRHQYGLLHRANGVLRFLAPSNRERTCVEGGFKFLWNWAVHSTAPFLCSGASATGLPAIDAH
jgi:hypothetical protein